MNFTIKQSMDYPRAGEKVMAFHKYLGGWSTAEYVEDSMSIGYHKVKAPDGTVLVTNKLDWGLTEEELKLVQELHDNIKADYEEAQNELR